MTTPLTDTQVRVLEQLRKGWRAGQGLAAQGMGLSENGRVRLVPPGTGAVDYVLVKTMRALELEGLVRCEVNGSRREWRLTASGWSV